MYKNFNELQEHARRIASRKRVAVAAAAEEHVLEAVNRAYLAQIIEPTLIGDAEKIARMLDSLGAAIPRDAIVPADTAQEAGLFFARVRTPGTDPRFVADLAALIRHRLDAGESADSAESVGSDPTTDRLPGLAGVTRRPDFCAPGCCVNARVTRPTTAAVDSAADWRSLAVDPARLVASGIPGVDATPR